MDELMITDEPSDDGRTLEWLGRAVEALHANMTSFIQGKPEVVKLSLICLLCEGHLLIEDVPGVGKTSLAKALAWSIRGSTRRIQFTPDLLPADVTGGLVWNQRTAVFEFRPGPVFANIVVADEINRASPKTQSALLQIMEEQQVTVDVETHEAPRPFMVIGTQNPIEHEGTYRLPESQLDRFLMKLSVGYPAREAEKQVVLQRVMGETPEQVLAPVVDTHDVQRMIQIIRRVGISGPLNDYLVDLAETTRRDPRVRLGVSPRGTIALALASRALAAVSGRSYVTADDVKAVAQPVLGHRMLLNSSAHMQGTSVEHVLSEMLATVPVPQDRRR
jgi:MoxR-like ATPase